MQFWLHCYTVVSYQAIFRLSVYKIPAIYLSGAKKLCFCMKCDFGSPTIRPKIVHPGGHMFYIGLHRAKHVNIFLSETTRPRALIFSMKHHLSRPLPSSFKLCPWGYNKWAHPGVQQQGISEPIFYGDLVYKFKQIVGKPNLSDLFKNIIKRYIKVGYNLDVTQSRLAMVSSLIARRWARPQTL